MDAASLDLYAATGGKVRDICFGGAKVGEMRVETKDGFTVYDPSAYAEWCYENDALDESEEIDWTRLTPAQAVEARQMLKDFYPEMFVETSAPVAPDESWLVWRDGICYDSESGEIVPGVRLETKVAKTVVRGCKWGGVPKKGGGWQFRPVADAVRGLAPAEVIGILTEGGAR